MAKRVSCCTHNAIPGIEVLRISTYKNVDAVQYAVLNYTNLCEWTYKKRIHINIRMLGGLATTRM